MRVFRSMNDPILKRLPVGIFTLPQKGVEPDCGTSMDDYHPSPMENWPAPPSELQRGRTLIRHWNE